MTKRNDDTKTITSAQDARLALEAARVCLNHADDPYSSTKDKLDDAIDAIDALVRVLGFLLSERDK